MPVCVWSKIPDTTPEVSSEVSAGWRRPAPRLQWQVVTNQLRAGDGHPPDAPCDVHTQPDKDDVLMNVFEPWLYPKIPDSSVSAVYFCIGAVSSYRLSACPMDNTYNNINIQYKQHRYIQQYIYDMVAHSERVFPRQITSYVCFWQIWNHIWVFGVNRQLWRYCSGTFILLFL